MFLCYVYNKGKGKQSLSVCHHCGFHQLEPLNLPELHESGCCCSPHTYTTAQLARSGARTEHLQLAMHASNLTETE